MTKDEFIQRVVDRSLDFGEWLNERSVLVKRDVVAEKFKSMVLDNVMRANELEGD